MSEQPLVSIITPCYNGETFVHRFFNSVLTQTYQNLELIFVNDGSTDGTEEIALKYIQKLEKREVKCRYIYHENRGPSGATNTGLALFQGDYLICPDSDDWMAPNCIEKMVDYLEIHTDKAIAICKGAIVPESDLNRPIGILERTKESSGWIFEYYAMRQSAYFGVYGSASWMIRAKMFLDVNPERHIYESWAGQNVQLHLPILYKYKCGFLDDVLWYYLLRKSSLSHQAECFRSMTDMAFASQDILEHVLKDIPMPEEERRDWLKKGEIRCIRDRLRAAAIFHERNALEEEYQSLIAANAATPADQRTYLRGKYKIIDSALKTVGLPMRVVRKIKNLIAIRTCVSRLS